MSTFVSTAVRAALIEAARADAHERLRAEAVVLAADDADDADDAEAAQVLRDMETLRGVGVCHLRFAVTPGAMSGPAPLRGGRPVRPAAAVDLAGRAHVHRGTSGHLPT